MINTFENLKIVLAHILSALLFSSILRSDLEKLRAAQAPLAEISKLCRNLGFCLFGGNVLLPFQKCPPISLDKMPLFKMPFSKGHFE